MPTQSALAALQAGIEPDATAARARTKNRVEASLSLSDMRRLLLVEAAETGDVSILEGRRLELLGRAETTLARLARLNGVEPIELRDQLRTYSEISEELFAMVRDGKADPAEALKNSGRTETAVKMDAEDVAAEAEQQAELQIPEPVLAKFTEALSNFATPADREPALQVLQQAMGLSKPAAYAVATSLLFAE
jgi:hypothetical protein